MANTKYTDDPAVSSLVGTEEMPIAQVGVDKKITVNQINGFAHETLVVAVSDETTALTTGTAKVTFRIPYDMTLRSVRASLTTAQTSGSILTIDVNKNGTSVLSTKLTVDNTEKTSTTAATQMAISDSTFLDDDEITIDIDQVGDGTAKGLKVTLIGRRS